MLFDVQTTLINCYMPHIPNKSGFEDDFFFAPFTTCVYEIIWIFVRSVSHHIWKRKKNDWKISIGWNPITTVGSLFQPILLQMRLIESEFINCCGYHNHSSKKKTSKYCTKKNLYPWAELCNQFMNVKWILSSKLESGNITQTQSSWKAESEKVIFISVYMMRLSREVYGEMSAYLNDTKNIFIFMGTLLSG